MHDTLHDFLPFNNTRPNRLDDILDQSSHLHAEANQTLLSFSEVSGHLYVVVQGEVEICCVDDDGVKSIVHVFGEGSCLNHQSFVELSCAQDSSFIRAAKHTTLLKIHMEAATQLSDQGRGLVGFSNGLGFDQLRYRLAQESALFRSIPLEHGQNEWFEQHYYEPGITLFKQDCIGDTFFLILVGQVEVSQCIDGKKEVIRVLGPGQYFGDHSLVNNEPHRHDVVSKTALTVLKISGQHFMSLYRVYPQLQQRLKTLGAIYQIPGDGTVTLYSSQIMGRESITSLYHFPTGPKLMVTMVIGENICSISLVSDASDKTDVERVNFGLPAEQKFREIQLKQGRLSAVKSFGKWDDVGEIVLRMLSPRKLKPWERALFRQEGKLQLTVANLDSDDALLCKCAGVSRGEVKKALQAGLHDIKLISDKTGASKICGGCSQLLHEVVGHSDMQLVDVVAMHRVSPDTKSFRFHPKHGELITPEAGQHIRVQAFIDGKWVQRAYTLTSAVHETKYYEITVKREPRGYFSRWLHDEMTSDAIVRVSTPQGGYTTTVNESGNAQVYFVAGIGVTPALAKLRSVSGKGGELEIYVDYSSSNTQGFVYSNEIKTIEASNEHIYINFRATSAQGHLNANTVKKITEHFPHASYFICGPSRYEMSVSRYLTKTGIEPEQVHIESFADERARQQALHLRKGNGIAAVCSTLALLACLIFTLLPVIPYPTSVLNDKTLQNFWMDHFNQQMSGFSILGVLLLGMGMSLRKRVKRFKAGDFVWWRSYHMLVGILAVSLFFFHTGLSFGHNLNRVLATIFMTSIALGASTMVIKLLDARRQSMGKDVGKSKVNFVHIILSSVLPAILAIHIFMTYYF